MAIITHKTSKNARYTDVLEYYSYRHQEDQKTGHYEPIKDEYGLLQKRENCAVAYITAAGEELEPELWAAACMRTNMVFTKNRHNHDRKNHEYIISHPTEDRDSMSMDDLLAEGKAFVRAYLAGYDALIGVHRDTDNDHVHISINSVRALPREHEESWMMRDNEGQVLPCEMKAGGKHQDSPGLRLQMNDWLLEYTRQHGLCEKDNNAIAAEHRAERHGAKNDYMRTALLEAASRSRNMIELQRIMREDHNIELKSTAGGKTISVLYPGNQKYVRIRTLGLEPEDLNQRFGVRDEEINDGEKKKYIEWIKSVRERNNRKAEMAAARGEEILAQQLRGRGERYNRDEFRDLRYLIRQTSYVSSNLQTELEKVDRILRRWEQYDDSSLPIQERRQHGGYIRWCGCAPDSKEELEALKAEREVILVQQAHVNAMCEALLSEVERWRGVNELTYAENDLHWTKQREYQLKQQLKNIRKSQKKLWKIACNCESAAKARERAACEHGISPEDLINPLWDKADYFRWKWGAAVLKEQELRRKVNEIKERKRVAKDRFKQVKRDLKNRT